MAREGGRERTAARTSGMHIYNAWLPPAVAAEVGREPAAFAGAVREARGAWRPDDPDSAYSTLKWIPIFGLFIHAKSDITPEDVHTLVELGLEIFHASQNKFVVQIKWGDLLNMLLKKHAERISLVVQWRPLYDTLVRTHFKRNMGPEGWKVKQEHFETVTSLVQASRSLFPEGAAAEIWSEFRLLLENPWHNSAFEGVGFLRLFLPANSRNQDHFTTEWIAECLDIWGSITNCNFWDIQWASIIARCIKGFISVDWENFLPLLFTRYLNMFEVPISSGNGSFPFPLYVPRNTRFLFSSDTGTPSKAIAKSIVYLLKPKSLAFDHFEKLISFLEQFYHPSNGGCWTYSLERFLEYLFRYFEKRLRHEQFEAMDDKHNQFCLGKEERAAFVKVVLKLLDRGQYSKDDSLAETVSVATSVLSYVEPSLVLPFVATNFQLALETTTATHQLENAVTSVAFSGRAILLSSLCSSQSDDSSTSDTFNDLIISSLSNALLGMDANDPPKTIATMQLIGSIFSNLAKVGFSDDVPAFLQTTSLSNWLDEFFCRLFSVLQNLESSSPVNEGYQSSIMSGTFLVEDSPYYFCMLEILLGKLSQSLFNQSLKKIAKFVNANILPGATSEVGLLCCACIHSYPEEASLCLIKPILMTIMSSFEGTPTTGYVGREVPNKKATKAMLSPALETALDYYLRVLAIAIKYAGPVLLSYKQELQNIITSSFQAPSWKVNGAGDHLLRSLIGTLVLYYPIDMYKPFSCQPIANIVEPWGCSKAHQDQEVEMLNFAPKWHDPSQDELSFANELLECHFLSALEDLWTICETKIHSETGEEKEHLKVTLLRIHSALQGVMSCLPEMRPSYKDGRSNVVEPIFFIAGSAGTTVGNPEMREKAAELVHEACRYLLKERTDNSILVVLIVRVIDALVNYGSLEYEEWSSHFEDWKAESTSVIEPPCNFIIPFHSQGKKRPRWALIDKTHMQNTWRCSQSSYHIYRMNADVSPSSLMINLMSDLLDLSIHNYETVRSYAGRSLTKLLNRWPSLKSNCVLTLTDNLRDSKASEHMVLGSCSILSSETILRHLTTDSVSLSSFIMGILESSHHESLKCQKAITELFVKYNIHFSGISRSLFKNTECEADKPVFLSLFSQINALGFATNSLHWRYNLMANRVLLLLILASRSESDIYSQILAETAGHFLRNLKSQLPHSRMLAMSALNALLQGSPDKASVQDSQQSLDRPEGGTLSTGGILNNIIREDGFMSETLNSLSHVHIISDNDGSSEESYGASSFMSGSDQEITYFYFDFSASWPRTPSSISLVGDDTFYSNFARIFKRLIQQCGMPVISSLQSALEEFLSSKERSMQCVAAEAMAGMLHSDLTGNLESENNWLILQLQKIMLAPSLQSAPEWAACIQYAVTGKGRSGSRAPVLRQKLLDFLCTPVPQSVATSVLAKRYSFLSVALTEISAPNMSPAEEQYHVKVLDELFANMSHPSGQVREAIGVTMCIACSNMQLSRLFGQENSPDISGDVSMTEQTGNENWSKQLTDGATELSVSIQNSISKHLESIPDSATENGLDKKEEADVKRMETIFHFIIASLKSGRSSVLLDVITGLIYPVLSLQETSNKDLSLLAKSAFELLKWQILRRPFLETVIMVILSSSNDPNWRTRSALLSYLRTFTYRHTFILSGSEKSQIWETIEKLLVDSQVEVREQAAGVLASLMKGIDNDLSKDFRDRSYAQAQRILHTRQRAAKSGHSVSTTHGAVLALTASVLSVPYDMPSWLPRHVTLLARFINEPSPIKSTVTKAVAEFKRTHADTWIIQKAAFTEDELEVLRDTSSSSSYFA